MIYKGTVKQIQAIEDYIVSTGNYTRMRDGRRPDDGDILKNDVPSAYSVLYEVYLSPDAKQYTHGDMLYMLKLYDYPHATLRMTYFHRDNRAEVKLSPHKYNMVMAAYPALVPLMAVLTYADNHAKTLTNGHIRA